MALDVSLDGELLEFGDGDLAPLRGVGVVVASAADEAAADAERADLLGEDFGRFVADTALEVVLHHERGEVASGADLRAAQAIAADDRAADADRREFSIGGDGRGVVAAAAEQAALDGDVANVFRGKDGGAQFTAAADDGAADADRGQLAIGNDGRGVLASAAAQAAFDGDLANVFGGEDQFVFSVAADMPPMVTLAMFPRTGCPGQTGADDVTQDGDRSDVAGDGANLAAHLVNGICAADQRAADKYALDAAGSENLAGFVCGPRVNVAENLDRTDARVRLDAAAAQKVRAEEVAADVDRADPAVGGAAVAHVHAAGHLGLDVEHPQAAGEVRW